MATTMHVSDVAELLSEGRTHFNLSPAVLVEHSIRRNEAKLAAKGCIVGYTNRTGRSPKDKFIVKDDATASTVAWGSVNAPFDPEKFDALYERVMDHLRGRELFVQDLFCGADPAYRLPVRIVTNMPGTTFLCGSYSCVPLRRNSSGIIPNSPSSPRPSSKPIPCATA